MKVNQIENGLDLTKDAQNIEAIYDTTLEPGKGIELHFHPDLEEIYYILSGYGKMTIGEEKQEITRYDVVYIPKLAAHALFNSGNVPLRFITLSVKVKGDKEYVKESFKQKNS
ncbi:MAG: cupin domain-containing protein [Candidatus Methanoperedens sp.]|nr:cupin domain-containing protein [Candidatus Methanoperedens sp.]